MDVSFHIARWLVEVVKWLSIAAAAALFIWLLTKEEFREFLGCAFKFIAICAAIGFLAAFVDAVFKIASHLP